MLDERWIPIGIYKRGCEIRLHDILSYSSGTFMQVVKVKGKTLVAKDLENKREFAYTRVEPGGKQRDDLAATTVWRREDLLKKQEASILKEKRWLW